MRAVILCEGTTDLLMIQYVLQYRYDWEYEGFLENAVTNKLLKKTLKKNGANIEIYSCGGITNIPIRMKSIKDQLEYVTRKEIYINEMAVLPEQQGQGIGKQLLNAVKSYSKDKGLAGIVLYTSEYAPAAKFYEKNGFKLSNGTICMYCDFS